MNPHNIVAVIDVHKRVLVVVVSLPASAPTHLLSDLTPATCLSRTLRNQIEVLLEQAQIKLSSRSHTIAFAPVKRTWPMPCAAGSRRRNNWS
jgi:hypothetical protein